MRTKRRGGLRFTATHEVKSVDLYTIYMDENVHDALASEVLLRIYSHCDVETLLSAYNVCNSWRAPFTDPNSNLISKFYDVFRVENEEIIDINESWTNFTPGNINAEFWRLSLFIRHACLHRARDALQL